ncbi:hypothetical protein Ancab_029591 [Ancistrocladus abbreviatus]
MYCSGVVCGAEFNFDGEICNFLVPDKGTLSMGRESLNTLVMATAAIMAILAPELGNAQSDKSVVESPLPLKQNQSHTDSPFDVSSYRQFQLR